MKTTTQEQPMLLAREAELGIRLMACERVLKTKREALGAVVGRHFHEESLDVADLIEWCQQNGMGDVAGSLHDLLATEAHWINVTRDYANASAKAERATA